MNNVYDLCTKVLKFSKTEEKCLCFLWTFFFCFLDRWVRRCVLIRWFVEGVSIHSGVVKTYSRSRITILMRKRRRMFISKREIKQKGLTSLLRITFSFWQERSSAFSHATDCDPRSRRKPRKGVLQSRTHRSESESVPSTLEWIKNPSTNQRIAFQSKCLEAHTSTKKVIGPYLIRLFGQPTIPNQDLFVLRTHRGIANKRVNHQNVVKEL